MARRHQHSEEFEHYRRTLRCPNGHRHALTNFDSQRIFNYAWSREGKLAMARGTDSSDVILISSEKQ